MARSADELVDEIRHRRRRVRAELRSLSSLDEVERRIRASPGWWVGGATLLGVVTARFFGPEMLRTGKRQLGSMVWGKVRSALFAAGVAAAGGRNPSGQDETTADLTAPAVRPDDRSA